MNEQTYGKLSAREKKKYCKYVSIDRVLPNPDKSRGQMRKTTEDQGWIATLSDLIFKDGEKKFTTDDGISVEDYVNSVPVSVEQAGNNLLFLDDGHHRLGALKRLGVKNIYVSTYLFSTVSQAKLIVSIAQQNDYKQVGKAAKLDDMERLIVELVDKRYYEQECGINRPSQDAKINDIKDWAQLCSLELKKLFPNSSFRIDSLIKRHISAFNNTLSSLQIQSYDKKSAYNFFKNGNNPVNWVCDNDKKDNPTTGIQTTNMYDGTEWKPLIALSKRNITKDCLAYAISFKLANPDKKIFLVCAKGNTITENEDSIEKIRESWPKKVKELNDFCKTKVYDGVIFLPQIKGKDSMTSYIKVSV